MPQYQHRNVGLFLDGPKTIRFIVEKADWIVNLDKDIPQPVNVDIELPRDGIPDYETPRSQPDVWSRVPDQYVTLHITLKVRADQLIVKPQ
jgi:hypothetical protein